ncbi:MAG: NAD(P)-binding domain-containing protein, partial [Sphingomonas sp.]|nr:NAD(P)-binding domain-containing protein [Sphingomonas sp.]
MKTIGVIGAGQMGAGIAQVSAQAGHQVLLSDVDLARAEA